MIKDAKRGSTSSYLLFLCLRFFSSFFRYFYLLFVTCFLYAQSLHLFVPEVSRFAFLYDHVDHNHFRKVEAGKQIPDDRT